MIHQRLRKHILSILFLCMAIEIHAQNYIDLFSVEYAGTPEVGFDSSDHTTSLKTLQTDLLIPLVVNAKTTVLTGLTYEMNSASFDSNRKKEQLHGLTLKLGLHLKHDSIWSGTYFLLPKLASDMQSISNLDFQIGGAVLMKNTRSDHFNYSLGVYANHELFGWFVVPMIGFYYLNPTEKIEIKATLPLMFDVNFNPWNRVKLGFNYKVQVRSYQINTHTNPKLNPYMAKQSNEIYSYLVYKINRIHLQFGVGHSLGRSYLMYNEKVQWAIPLVYFDDARTSLNSSFQDSWLIKFSSFYRFRI